MFYGIYGNNSGHEMTRTNRTQATEKYTAPVGIGNENRRGGIIKQSWMFDQEPLAREKKKKGIKVLHF